MLTPKFIRENMDSVKENLKKRNSSFKMNSFESLEKNRLNIIKEIEAMKAKKNQVSKEIGDLKKTGKGTADEQINKLLFDMKNLSDEVKQKDKLLATIEDEVNLFCQHIPNMLDPDVPFGKSEADNVEIKRFGKPKSFDFEVKDHVDLGLSLDILDFERAAKLAGSRFVVLKGRGAMLNRAIAHFFLSENISAGYTEYYPPVIVNQKSLYSTGQLPKFEEDLFRLKNQEDYYLSPTAEVPLTNLVRDEILSEKELPLKLTAFTSCFRSEAGAAGKDTRGMIRQHQFDKVELVKIAKPETSKDEHEALLADAEQLLKKLELPYRVILLCSGDSGFGHQKCYDIEVWLPSKKKYVEISSCSNFGPFQAQRAGIRYKEEASGKNIVAHTVNGSALAIGRTLVAILENFQNADGSVDIPEVLTGFTGFKKIIKS